MTEWDSPNRSRGFLAAAMLVAACGALVSWTATYDLARLEPSEGRTLGDVVAGRPASKAASASASAAAGASVMEEDDIRDALAAAPPSAPAFAFAGARGAFPGGTSSNKLAASGPGDAAAAARSLSAAPTSSALTSALEAVSGTAPRRASAPAQAAPAARPDAVAENRRLLLDWVAAAASGRPASRRAAPRRPAASPEADDADSSASLLVRERARRETEDAVERERAQRRRGARRFKAPTLAKLLGRALRPPKLKIAAPKAKPWTRAKPAFGPDGRPLALTPFAPELLDAVDAPEALRKSCARQEPHWHEDPAGGWWHDGRAWGRLQGTAWAWTEKEGARWWAWTAPDARAVLEHQDRWWLQSQGYWFLMHDGLPWGYWFIRRFGQEGFENIHGQQLLYSADERVLAVVTPGSGAAAYDAATGAQLGSWTEDELPARLRLKPPILPALP